MESWRDIWYQLYNGQVLWLISFIHMISYVSLIAYITCPEYSAYAFCEKPIGCPSNNTNIQDPILHSMSSGNLAYIRWHAYLFIYIYIYIYIHIYIYIYCNWSDIMCTCVYPYQFYPLNSSCFRGAAIASFFRNTAAGELHSARPLGRLRALSPFRAMFNWHAAWSGWYPAW